MPRSSHAEQRLRKAAAVRQRRHRSRRRQSIAAQRSTRLSMSAAVSTPSIAIRTLISSSISKQVGGIASSRLITSKTTRLTASLTRSRARVRLRRSPNLRGDTASATASAALLTMAIASLPTASWLGSPLTPSVLGGPRIERLGLASHPSRSSASARSSTTPNFTLMAQPPTMCARAAMVTVG